MLQEQKTRSDFHTGQVDKGQSPAKPGLPRPKNPHDAPAQSITPTAGEVLFSYMTPLFPVFGRRP
jgi:hypothetical protein